MFVLFVILWFLFVLCVFLLLSVCDYVFFVGVFVIVMFVMCFYVYVVLKLSLKFNGIEKLCID